ncbi:MetQ/NlpA family ABC transporter substrate-binding protein [Actinoplanes couchii]|uniref:Lipoprotein n=1 Tax=Actinoplanes couchii TaxID=403638 RepID=A0ABQ3X0F1_9ACTN|nr:MetQ/NlpA family ABC transporter substrate-binding protein [Actinoplanes couchii]MDR6316386.1 D-methionine transport system substrate-binding protein [Actinoplanes couchii]GID52000.1 lipoprotein [Actinoplanes couchii]
MRRRSFAAVLAATTLTLGLAACGSSDDAAGDSAASDTLKVGVSPVPHGEILKYVADNLAAAEGLKIEITEFNDYIQPNVALSEKQLDANYFQHIPYLEEEVATKGYKFTALKPVHIEPLGVYSKTVKAIADVPNGGVVAIPNDPSNSGRSLNLLAKNGLITLKDGVGVKATEKDITANPKNLQFKALEAAQLPRSLEDTAISVINGNYAIETGLKPATDSLALETGDDNPYANLVVVRTGDETNEKIVKLEKLLHSAEVKKFIEDKYQGSVLAAF